MRKVSAMNSFLYSLQYHTGNYSVERYNTVWFLRANAHSTVDIYDLMDEALNNERVAEYGI
jgi:hypothetical protein